MFDHIHLMFQ